MKKCFFLFLLLSSVQLAAQKQTRELIDAAGISAIEIGGEEIYKVTIKTVPGDEIRIFSKADGEYFDEISLDILREEHIVYLQSRFREILQSGYDKLSAHKVFAMEIELEIPENMSISINSNVASVFMAGNYDEVLIESKTGSSYLENFTGDAVINTYDGNINVVTSNADIQAESRHGGVEVPLDNGGRNKIVLTTINGNIKVQETK